MVPIFFEAEEGRPLTGNSDRYVQMLQDFVRPELQARQLNNIRFQQDGAMPHTALQSRAVLQRLFPNRLFSHSGDLTWQTRLPDLTVFKNP